MKASTTYSEIFYTMKARQILWLLFLAALKYGGLSRDVTAFAMRKTLIIYQNTGRYKIKIFSFFML